MHFMLLYIMHMYVPHVHTVDGQAGQTALFGPYRSRLVKGQVKLTIDWDVLKVLEAPPSTCC